MKNLKASIPVEWLAGEAFNFYAWGCGTILARAHARTGEPAIRLSWPATAANPPLWTKHSRSGRSSMETKLSRIISCYKMPLRAGK